MPPARVSRRGRVSPLLMLLVGLTVIAVVSVNFQKSIAGSQLGRILAGGSSGSGGGGARRRLSAGEVQRQLNALGGSTRVALEPDLLRHLQAIAVMYREDESRFLKWTKDVGLLRLQQYQDFLRQSSEGTLTQVDSQERPPRAPDLTSTYLDVDILRRAYRAALAAEGSDLRFVQWMRGIGLLTAETYKQLEMRLADEEAGQVDKVAWEKVKMDWVKRHQKIEERRKAAEKVVDT